MELTPTLCIASTVFYLRLMIHLGVVLAGEWGSEVHFPTSHSLVTPVDMAVGRSSL